MALIAGLWVYSCGSPGDAQTYVSRSDSTDVAWDGPSSFLVAQHREDSIIVNREVYGKQKDPGKALVYALVPGLVVHGAGHFYAGDKTAGWVLAGGEILGLCLIAYYLGVRNEQKPMESTLNDEAETIGYFGVGLFVGTWIYDVIGAPVAVQRENREFLGGENARLRFGFDHTSHSVRIQMAKSF